MSENGHHIVTPNTYIKVLIGLLILMGLTMAFGRMEALEFNQTLNLIIALTIAVCKMLLVVMFFMHVKYSDYLTWVIAAAGFFWLMIMFVLTFNDYLTRNWMSPFLG